MEKIKYIIIDDEPPAHITVRFHVNQNPNYSLVASFYNAQTALSYLEANEVDLIFLDIEMPEMNGFQFLEALNKSIFVVFLTAYPKEFGLDAHRFIDKDLVYFTNKAQFTYYLPRILERFEKMYEDKKMLNRLHQLSVNEILMFPKKFHKKLVPLKDIVFFLTVGHHIVLTMEDGKEEICRMSIPELTSFLPANDFLRISRSVIINTLYITAFTDATVSVLEHHFRISTRRRKEIAAMLQARKQELYKET
jgi:DNA-binding LytR/AlgR family response regulator